jgi:hypothetical protein
MSELDASVSEDGSQVVVSVTREVELPGLDGSVEPREIQRQEVRVDAEVAEVEAIALALLEWVANGPDGAGPPGQKPMHDQYASMEPDR